MTMVQLNDLVPPAEGEDYWTILGDQHEELPDDKEYVIFELYCSTPTCHCKALIADIREIGADGRAVNKPTAMIEYDWSTAATRCEPALLQESPKTPIAFDLLKSA